jgi:DMSO reductase anchor subunit
VFVLTWQQYWTPFFATSLVGGISLKPGLRIQAPELGQEYTL